MTKLDTEQRIVNAATEFVLAHAEKLRLHKLRSEMLRKLFSKDEFECCMKFEDGCYQAMRDGQLNDNTQFCEYCAKIHDAVIEYQKASDKTTGKLRALTNAVNKKLNP